MNDEKKKQENQKEETSEKDVDSIIEEMIVKSKKEEDVNDPLEAEGEQSLENLKTVLSKADELAGIQEVDLQKDLKEAKEKEDSEPEVKEISESNGDSPKQKEQGINDAIELEKDSKLNNFENASQIVLKEKFLKNPDVLRLEKIIQDFFQEKD